MNFKNAIKTCLKDKYANFSGRASRSEFWFFSLFILICYVISFIFIAISLNFFVIIFGILVLGVVIPGFAVAVRRLHDVNKSGWFVLLPLPFDLLEGIFERSSGDVTSLSLIFTFISLGLYIYLLVLYCTAGKKKKNIYGKPIKLKR